MKKYRSAANIGLSAPKKSWPILHRENQAAHRRESATVADVCLQ
jgi:hypothetical protein